MATTRPGMGAIPHADGVAFRVWAPNAQSVAVTGTFNGWSKTANPLTPEGNGYWYTDVSSAKIGHEYEFALVGNAGQALSRIDPYAREVTHSSGKGVVHNPAFDWGTDSFQMPAWNRLVIYELHVGTFNDPSIADGKPGRLSAVVKKFEYLKSLGVNAIQIMPVGEFAGDHSWGYNSAYIFAVESAYGGSVALKQFVKDAHQHGFAVILDVVYNHFGPSDLSLWQFDGWSQHNKGGIYFYNDERSNTPWGDTRPDYGRSEVQQYIRDNALQWLDDYRFDGLRWDMTLYIRSIYASGQPEIPAGWGLMQWVNEQSRQQFPGKLTIAEDLQNNSWITKDVGAGGAGFGTQWDAHFVHPVRRAVITPNDDDRSMAAVADAIRTVYNGDAFERVVYTESHDEVANGKARVPHEINPKDSAGWYAQKRSTLAAGLVFTAPGIPMIFQGQEFLEGGWFRDTVPLDWARATNYSGIVALYRDLIRLRLNAKNHTRGLSGHHVDVYHVNDADKLLAFARWDQGGKDDAVVVVANFRNAAWTDYRIGLPATGRWRLLFNSDWNGYSQLFGNHFSDDVIGHAPGHDGLPAHGRISIGPYSLLIFAQTD